ncbi:15608_t:CDS:2, partial [Dentiscutata erythropus]
STTLEVSGMDAYNDLIDNRNVRTFAYLLRASLLTRAPVSLAPMTEEVLQGIVEMKGEGRFGFLDLFFVGDGQCMSIELKRYIKTSVKVILENGVKQLESYIKVIEKGKVTKYTDPGIFDDHINTIKTNKPCIIHGFVVM